jgi:hypothetical protein
MLDNMDKYTVQNTMPENVSQLLRQITEQGMIYQMGRNLTEQIIQDITPDLQPDIQPEMGLEPER